MAPPGARESHEVAGHLGLLALDGLLARSTVIAGAPCPELLGPRDLLAPWPDEGGFASLPYEATWEVLEPTRVALLDARFASVVCRWSTITAALLERMMERQRWISLRVALGHLRRVDARVLILLWHLGDRWGSVRADGVHLPMRLTRAFLARLVGAQRPSVTLALTELVEQRRVRREGGHCVLARPAPDLAELLRAPGGQRRDAAAR